MTPRLYLRTMWRQSRGARGRMFFFCACVAVGVAAVVGVSTLVDSVEAGIRARSRDLLGGDLAIEARRPLPDLLPLLPQSLRRPPPEMVHMRILRTMVHATDGTSMLAQVKAVEAPSGRYPLAGELVLAPPGRFDERVTKTSVAVAPEVLQRLRLSVGDTLHVGGKPFRIAATVVAEPSSLGFSLAIAPRVFMTRGALESTDLLSFGSRIRYRTLLAAPAGNDQAQLAAARTTLESRIEGGGSYVRVESHTEAQPALRTTLERVHHSLGLVALLSLLLSSVGVAQIVSSWLAQSVPQTAVLRCLGMRPREVMALYLGQVLLLSLLGSAAGAALGTLLMRVTLDAYPQLLPVGVSVGVSPAAIARGMLLGVAVSVVFSLAPLTAVYRVPPARVLRAEAEPLPVPRRVALLCVALAVLGVYGAALAQSQRPLIALGFTGGVGLLTAVLWSGARGLLWAVSRLPRRRLPPVLWQGAASLSRPGAGVVGSIVALGLGTLVVLGITLLQGLLGEQLRAAIPEDAPTVFMADVQPDQWPGVQEVAAAHDARNVDGVPVVMARLAAVDGLTVSELLADRGDPNTRRREHWVLTREQRITIAAEAPEHAEIIEGQWWHLEGVNEVSLERDFARDVGARLGSVLRFDVQGVPLEFTVTSIRNVEWRSFAPNFFLVAEPGPLDEAPQFVLGVARVDEAREAAMQDAVSAQYPNVTVFRARSLVNTAVGLLEQVAVGVNLLGVFAIATGLLILVASVASTQLRRGREAALLKTLGLTRKHILVLFTVEYALSALVAGLLGAAGAFWLVKLVAVQVLKLSAWPSLGLSVAAALTTILLALAGSLVASARALVVPPSTVFRDN